MVSADMKSIDIGERKQTENNTSESFATDEVLVVKILSYRYIGAGWNVSVVDGY